MSSIQSSENTSRAFKGIWIPAEIWEHPNLSIEDKVLWAEIDSLDHKKTHCTASNDYLCKFFGWKIRTLQRALSKLKSLGLIEQVSYDGRVRVIKSHLGDTHDKFDTSDMSKGGGYDKFDTSDMSNLTHPPTPTPYIHIDNKEDNKEKKEKKREAPQAGPRPDGPVDVLNFGSHVKLSKEQHEELCKVHGPALIEEMISAVNDYIDSHGKKPYKDYPSTIRNFIRRRKDKINQTQSVANNVRGSISKDRNLKDENGNRYTDYDNLW